MKRSLLFAALVACAAPLWAADPSRWTLQLDVGSTRIEGTPLHWSSSQVQLLTREGRLWSFNPNEAKAYRKLSSTFQSYSPSDLRERLSRELGKSFEVSNTGHFLVANPRGQRDVWSTRFEKLYNGFKYYFSVRGFNISEPEFPLVAIIWSNQDEFLRYATSDGAKIGPGTLGYYSSKSNRITLFDTSNGSDGDAWQQNADTIIHEATHQTAFNTGVHRRFAETPRWVVEGLAMMFEARGVYDSRRYSTQKERYNAGRLAQFKQMAPERRSAALQALVSSDRMFDSDVQAAYACSWVLSFYLVENQPQKYSKYLKKLAERAPFEAYPAAARTADFASTFEPNFTVLEKRLTKFINDLK
jgi:hypothetical protein